MNIICEQIDGANDIPSFYVNGWALTLQDRKLCFFQTRLRCIEWDSQDARSPCRRGPCVAPCPLWQSLIWSVSLTVLWIVLIYWRPIIPASE
jgi:hypothetical protein